MQRPNYWPRSSYNPRDGSWVQSWYGTSYVEEKDVRSSTYDKNFFINNHMQRTEQEYYSSSDVQIIAEKRSSFTNPISSPIHHSPLSESVSPNSSFSESSFRISSPRNHIISVPQSPQSHCIDVSSPVSYQSDEASPRLSHSSPPRSQKYYDPTSSQNLYSDYESTSRTLPLSRTNSSHTTQFHREVHSNITAQTAELANRTQSYMKSSRNDRTFNNSSSFKRYETTGSGWPAYRSNRQSFPRKKNAFTRPNHVSYSDKPRPHKPRSADSDRPMEDKSVMSPSKINNASGYKASVNGDKNDGVINVPKSNATAPPVEKSITNLISKLFHQDSAISPMSSICAQEKNVKISSVYTASSVSGEMKPKSKGVLPATTALSSRQRDQVPARMGSKSEQNSNSVPQTKIGVRLKNTHLRESASSTGKLPSDKADNVKRNSVLKSPLKIPQPRNLVSVPHLQSNSSSDSESCRDKQTICKANALPNSVASDVDFVSQKLCEDESQRNQETPLKNLRARISIGSRNKVLPKETSPTSSLSTSEHLSTIMSENLNETFSGHISFKSAPDSVHCSKRTPGKTLKARKSGWDGRTHAVMSSEDKVLCNGDVDTQEEDFEPKARKSFRPQLSSPASSSVVSEHIESDMKNITSKKKRRRHFRGGRYDMSLKPKKKKEKKANEKQKSEDSMGGDSSETSEMAEDISLVDNSNSGDQSRVSCTSESFPRTRSSNDVIHALGADKSFTDVNSILKMPLKDFLWSKLDTPQDVNAESNPTTCENILQEQQHIFTKNMDLLKSTKQLSISDPAKNNFEKVRGVARKTQVSYRQQQSRSLNINLNCSVKPRSDNNINLCRSNMSSEQNRCASDPSAGMGSKPDSLNQDSDIEIVGFVEHKSVGNAPSRGPIVHKTQDGKILTSLAGFSSDSDDEVLIKKIKRGSSEISCTSGDGTNAERKASHLSNGATRNFYTKDSKLPKSLCTCLAKSLCDSSTQFPEEMLICQAVDTIDGELVCCRNKLGKSNLVRPSLKIPYIAMCESHLARLRQHQCCPNCGFFCTQGVFLQCITVDPKTKEHHFHFLHHTCQTPVANGEPVTCPHCGNYSKFKTATLKRSALSSSDLSPFMPGDDKRVELEIMKQQHEGSKQDLCNADLEMPDDMFIPGNKQRRYIPDELQLKAMADTVASEKSINLRPSGKSFYAPVKSGDIDKVLQLLTMGVDPNHKFEHHNNDTPLHVASEAGFPLVVHSLVQAGASINVLNNNLYSPIMLAVDKKHISVVQYLLMAEAQVNVKSEVGMTCLHLAACGGNIFLCKIILDNPHLKINIQDEGGWTPLVWAAEHKNFTVVKLLLDRGADANIMDMEKNNALHWAAFSGSVEIARLLLDWGCQVNTVNEHGDTPLHIAAREDNYECVVLFLARGASTSLKNYGAQQTPIMCCKSNSSSSWMVLSVHSELQKWKEGKVKCERVVAIDISRGKEEDPIQVVNGVDDEPAPSDFYYVLESCETSDIHVDTNVTYMQSCKCEDTCASLECCCSVLSFQCWYSENGCLTQQFFLTEPPLLFECNKLCLCWKSCRNRVVQFGIKCRLQIFRTQGKGWGVRTLKNIPKGSFICEYVGEVITDLDADHRDDDSYLFDLDSRDSDSYCLDARYYGNVSRFINHLCDANLVPVKVFIDHHDLKFPRIAFFSSRDIEAFEELGFDYGDKFWRIKSKWFHCECGSPLCRYSSRGIAENAETEVLEQGSETSCPS